MIDIVFSAFHEFWIVDTKLYNIDDDDNQNDAAFDKKRENAKPACQIQFGFDKPIRIGHATTGSSGWGLA